MVEISKAVVEIHPHPDHPAVLQLEADVIDGNIDLTLSVLAHQHRHAQVAGLSAAHDVQDRLERSALVCDVIHDEDLARSEARRIDRLDPNLNQVDTLGPGRAQEHDVGVQLPRREPTHQLLREGARSFRDHDQEWRAPGIVVQQVIGERIDAFPHLACGVELAQRHIVRRHAAMLVHPGVAFQARRGHTRYYHRVCRVHPSLPQP